MPAKKTFSNQSPQQFAQQRASGKLFGFKIRTKLFSGEDEFFKNRPEVAGMAAEDDTIILNPYSKLSKKHKELTKKWRSIKVNKTNFDKLTNQQRTKRYNNATKTINQLGNQRNEVLQSIDEINKKLKKIKKKIKNVRNTIRYYST